MSNELVVHKGRLNKFRVSMGQDISADTITSEIRTQPTVDATLIATFDVSFETDGTDGLLIIALDDQARDVTASKGYMDFNRVVAGDSIPMLDKSIEVIFRPTVTMS